ncbi:MAG TPA: manganese efflux pump [Streptosporangiaceae bacterium]|jgi:putative Mn2+ efflux pump MntP
MVALLLVAVSVGLSNFAASIGIGISGVDNRVRLRVGLVFGVFEAGMPIVGLFLGHQAATAIGSATRWLAGALLIGLGLYGLAASRRGGAQDDGDAGGADRPGQGGARAAGSAQADRDARAGTGDRCGAGAGRGGGLSRGRLLLSGLALSIDNLVIGFALGTYRVDIVTGAIVIGLVSVALSLAGLELGARLGRWSGRASEQLGGVILIGVGIAVAAGALS